MNYKYFLIVFIHLISIFPSKNLYSLQKAIINVPIADLLGQSITTIYPDKKTECAYEEIPFCSSQIHSAASCPRLHQLLYNETVDVIKSTDEEVCIQINNAYYLNPSSSLPQTYYWMLKKNVTFFDDITAHNIPSHHIPEPINFNDSSHLGLNQNNIITLSEPHFDPTSQMTFSAGTRFIQATPLQKKRTSTYTVFAINYKTYKEYHIKIPIYKCIISNTTKIRSDKITDYINVLKKWAHRKQNTFIPYTWGGTSFTHTTHGNFKEITKTTHHSDYSFYEYETSTPSPKSGFDCSGVILRATQICGIPYFCKNTSTIAHCLTLLQPNQTLCNGDIILIKGHVMIVSDIIKNLLIEARSYGHGYGKLHEIPLNQVFEDIHTYKDLTDAFFNKITIKRKDKQGKIRDTFSQLQLFPIASAWKD